MIHDFDELLSCNRLGRNDTNGFLRVNNIGTVDFVFRPQDDNPDWKPVNIIGIFTKDRRIAVTDDKYLPLTPVVKRDEEYSYLKDTDSVVRQAVKRLSCESDLRVQFDEIRMLGCIEDESSLTYVYQANIIDVDCDCELHIIDINHLKISAEVPTLTKMIVSELC